MPAGILYSPLFMGHLPESPRGHMNQDQSLLRTPLYEKHLQAGARMVPFGGWEMPVQYEGILAEHHAVRTAAGLFDVSHMGRVELHGPEALAFVNYVTINDAERLRPYESQYSAACYENGGIVDDLLVYRCPDRILVVLNAGNRSKDLAWLQRHIEPFRASMVNVSDKSALLALQGPEAAAILARMTDAPIASLAFQQFLEASVVRIPTRVFRTGYTGEDGFELWCADTQAAQLWDALLEAGAESGLKPCGLGARDTLRLEAGLCLYGHEIDETTNPLEAGLSWITKLTKPDFVGKAALVELKKAGTPRRLAGFKMLERAIPRQGYLVLSDSTPVGTCVSGTMSPTLGYGIGTAYLPNALKSPGTLIEVDIRGKQVKAEVVKLPFYSQGSRR